MKSHRQKFVFAPPLTAIALCFAVVPSRAQYEQAPPTDVSPADYPSVDPSTGQRRATDLPPPNDPLVPSDLSGPANPTAVRDSESTPAAEDRALSQAQAPSSTAATAESSDLVQIASPEASDRGLRQFAGQQVRTANGEKLGTVKDFVVDATTGEVTHAVVSSGGFLGAGDTLRAVPRDALQQSTEGDGFTVQIQADRWSDVPALSEQDSDAGRINLGDDERRQLSQVFGRGLDPQSASSATPSSGATTDATRTDESGATSGTASHLQLASALRGKTVQAGDQTLGEVEEVVIDLSQGIATALIDPSDGFASSDANYLVPIQRLDLAPGKDMATTTLTRADFDQAPMQSVAATETSLAPTGRDATDRSQTVAGTSTATQPVSSQSAPSASVALADEQLSPTGRTSAEQSPQADEGLMESARAVRQALDQNTALATANVQVTPQNDRLVLRGSVRDDKTKSAVERAARDAANSAQIDNQITVENSQNQR